MTSLLPRAATCAGLAAAGLSTLSQAQDTALVLPERTQLRRALPVAAAPIVQQSPNGLYQLSITDAGIELRGPKGVVKITDAGIVIGEPNTTRVEIHSGDMLVRVGQSVRLDTGTNLEIKSSGSLDLRGAAVQVTSGAASMNLDTGASLLGSQVRLGCPNGKPAARVGDVVNTSVSPAVVAQGAPTVLVC